jgi:hypothetical protein
VFSFTQSKADSGPPGLEKKEIYKNIENQMPAAVSFTSDFASFKTIQENSKADFKVAWSSTLNYANYRNFQRSNFYYKYYISHLQKRRVKSSKDLAIKYKDKNAFEKNIYLSMRRHVFRCENTGKA